MTAIATAAMIGAAQEVRSTPDLGKAEGRCRSPETGAAFLVDVEGLKDRSGLLRAELYPAVDGEFLADDDVLVRAGKTFARVEIPIPKSGSASLCIRAPHPGKYTLSILHDRDANRKFGLSIDGVGFSNNPRLGLSKPKAAAVAVAVGPNPIRLRIVMNYRRGLISFGPIKR